MKKLKKTLKILGLTLGVVILLAGAFAYHTWNYKPVTINLFFARTFLKVGLESPEMLSSLRVLEPLGIRGHNAKLDDESIEAGTRFFQLMKDAHEVLLSYEDEDLDESDRMSKRVAMSFMDLLLAGERFRFHNYPVNPLFGVQNGFPSFMESTHQVHDVKDAEQYITRLSAVGVKFDQVLEGLRHRETLDILPPQFVVTKVLEEMRAFVATPAEEGILMSALLKKMQEAGLEKSEQQRLAGAAREQIETVVYPAYGRLIAYFEKLDYKVSENYGVWNLPDGDELYALAIRLFTTTDYSAEEIHQFGLSEVDRIQGEILQILEDEGWDVSEGFSPAITELAERPEFYYSDSAEGRESILADYQAIIDEVSEGLEPYFDVRHESGVEVQRIPEFKEKTSPGAYYQRPAMDGSRPGVFYANLYDIKATPKYSMRTLAYHEAIPGHHFQLAIMQQQEDLPLFRRLIPNTAYTEGWALYAERVAWELGFLEDPYDNIGRLQGELFRAVRLVVDTGIHAKRWSRERAIEYMLTNTGMAESDVVAEIERYFVLPGQALAYKVGMTKILELRDRAQKELGDRFDIRAFHRVLLTNGSLPLNILEDLVNQYIEETRA
ncbi:MAG TPA: DUF885 domain-containing protein [Xanthomonadales bacterium]|nr:DUF885 domain-containing protein [Xanthomonadales bacterium]